MREVLTGVRTGVSEGGAPLEVSYYLTEEDVMCGHFGCESYGVRVVEAGGEEAAFPHLTVSRTRIVELLTALCGAFVTPVTAGDVVADWL